ncbi:MAG: phosphatidylinositol mannoside acyltransferase [Acidimicrobiales bacterium]|nr:phosphatidylinositol mannoside acyltransferase [Acidimicrobiales bacterium]
MADLITTAYKVAAGAARLAPNPVATRAVRGLGRIAARRLPEKRRIAARNIQRARPDLTGRALERAVTETFESYARYYLESFRLPGTSAADLDAGFSTEGYEHIEAARAAGKGAIMALPHLGGWEWAGLWLSRVRDIPVTVVVERLDPPSLFEWFVELRHQFGMEVVALGPEAGTATSRALKANHLLALLCDRDLAGTGPEVEFFGERTTLPGGPATLALRTGAPILPTAIYFDGPRRHAVVKPPLDTARRGGLREDVARITQDVAHALEDLIRAAPQQWHLLQPNWPSDRS